MPEAEREVSFSVLEIEMPVDFGNEILLGDAEDDEDVSKSLIRLYDGHALSPEDREQIDKTAGLRSWRIIEFQGEIGIQDAMNVLRTVEGCRSPSFHEILCFIACEPDVLLGGTYTAVGMLAMLRFTLVPDFNPDSGLRYFAPVDTTVFPAGTKLLGILR